MVADRVVLHVLYDAIVFRSIYAEYFNRTLRQTGNNISSILEGALYYSMLENDKLMLHRN